MECFIRVYYIVKPCIRKLLCGKSDTYVSLTNHSIDIYVRTRTINRYYPASPQALVITGISYSSCFIATYNISIFLGNSHIPVILQPNYVTMMTLSHLACFFSNSAIVSSFKHLKMSLFKDTIYCS